MNNSLSHASSSDSEQGGSSSGRESHFELSSIMEGQFGATSDATNLGDGGQGAIPVAPVARQTTLVLQGYFTEEARLNNPDVSEHFSRLQGSGLTAADDEALFQLGLEMNRASLQLRERYSRDFEEMMGELGTSLSDVFSGLTEIAGRLFHNPSEISWSRILTFFSFAAWVLIKKGIGFMSGVLNQAQGLLSRVTNLLGSFNVFSWISGNGGWTANKSHLTNEASIEAQHTTGDGAIIPKILHNPPLKNSVSQTQANPNNANQTHSSGPSEETNAQTNGARPSRGGHRNTAPREPSTGGVGSGSSTLLYVGGAALVAGVAFLLYRHLK